MKRDRRTAQVGGGGSAHVSFLNLVAGTAGVNVVVSALGSVGGLLLARTLGPSGRGDLATIIVWPTLIGNLAAIGLPQATCYWVARRPADRRVLLATSGISLGALGLLVGAGGVAIAGLIGRSPTVVMGLRVSFAFMPVVFVLSGLLSGLQATYPRRWNVCRIVQPAVYFGLIVALMLTNALTVGRAVAVLIASLLAQLAVVIPTTHRSIGPLASPELALTRPLFHYGVRSIVSSAPWLVNGRLDQLVLSVTVSSAALGKYAVAVSLSFLVAPISTAFGTMAFPRIASATSESDVLAVERTSIIGCVGTAAAVVLPLAIIAPWLVARLFGAGYSGAVMPLRLLAPGAVAFATNQVISDILRGRGRPLAVAVAEGVAAVATVVLLAILIPRYGISGAAFASTIAYSITTGLLIRALRARQTADLRYVGSPLDSPKQIGLLEEPLG